MPDRIKTQADLKMLIDGYDASLAYADFHVGQVLDTLEELGVLDETAVIVTGDHGDSFGEHSVYLDHTIGNEAVHNVPMVVSWPGILPGSPRSDALIYSLDLGPTLCDLLDLPVPTRWDGRSFGPALRGDEFRGWAYQVWEHGIYTLTRSIRTPRWLLMELLHPGVYPYDEVLMLYDMLADPHQEVNQASQRPDVVRDLRARVNQWRREQLEKSDRPDPLEQMVPIGPFLYYTPEQMAARLERTGRSHLVPGMKARLERYHPGRY
jgi:arylsulfatase A-like enzyme